MNKRTIITLGTILGVIICIGATVGWGVYKLLSIPSIKEGVQSAGGEFGAMFDMQQQLLQSYPCQNAGVQIMNGHTLNISLVNSEFNDISSSQQSRTAREIAVFVKDNYTGKAEISQIVITFIQHNQIGPINTNRSSSYPFDMSELEGKDEMSG